YGAFVQTSYKWGDTTRPAPAAAALASKAPVVPVAAMSWRGFYIGAHLGGGWSRRPLVGSVRLNTGSVRCDQRRGLRRYDPRDWTARRRPDRVQPADRLMGARHRGRRQRVRPARREHLLLRPRRPQLAAYRRSAGQRHRSRRLCLGALA